MVGLHLRSVRGAYAALVVLTLLWASNWIVMKFALGHAHPVLFNLQRTWIAVAVCFGVLWLRGGPFWPESWVAVVVTGLLQTTINYGSTTMALAGGGAGRTSVLVFTMPFWTLLIAWPVLGERVRGAQWLAIACAIAGLTLLVAPWDWQGPILPRLWAVLSGFGWAAGTIATKYFQRARSFDMVNFLAWGLAIGVLPLSALPLFFDLPATQWSVSQVLLTLWIGAVATAFAFMLWIEILRFLPAGTASLGTFAIPALALSASMLVFGERLSGSDWIGIGFIAAGLAQIAARAFSEVRRGESTLATPTPLDGG